MCSCPILAGIMSNTNLDPLIAGCLSQSQEDVLAISQWVLAQPRSATNHWRVEKAVHLCNKHLADLQYEICLMKPELLSTFSGYDSSLQSGASSSSTFSESDDSDEESVEDFTTEWPAPLTALPPCLAPQRVWRWPSAPPPPPPTLISSIFGAPPSPPLPPPPPPPPPLTTTAIPSVLPKPLPLTLKWSTCSEAEVRPASAMALAVPTKPPPPSPVHRGSSGPKSPALDWKTVTEPQKRSRAAYDERNERAGRDEVKRRLDAITNKRARPVVKWRPDESRSGRPSRF